MFVSNIYSSLSNWALHPHFTYEEIKAQPDEETSPASQTGTVLLFPLENANVSCADMAVGLLILMTLQQNIQISLVFQRSHFEATTVMPLTNAPNIS